MTLKHLMKQNRLSLCGLTLLTIALASATSSNAADKVDFGKQVYPILKENCLNCHADTYVDAKSGRKKKPKGGLRLDTHEWIMKGYEDDDDKWKVVVVAGKPEKSTFFTSTTLDPDHDDIMPAKGDLLTKAQQETLKLWIAQGAESNGFEAPAYVNLKGKK
jgi:mono/diheme cytochrome c family protein